jgi:hypothetical protein
MEARRGAAPAGAVGDGSRTGMVAGAWSSEKISDGRNGWRRCRSDARARGGGGRQGSWAGLSAPLLLPLLGRAPSQTHLRLRVAPAIAATAGAPEPPGCMCGRGWFPRKSMGLLPPYLSWAGLPLNSEWAVFLRPKPNRITGPRACYRGKRMASSKLVS